MHSKEDDSQEQLILPLVNRAGEYQEPAFVVLSESETGSCGIRLQFSQGVLEEQGENYFDVLVNIRNRLETYGFYLGCAGASRGYYPSGMSKSMGTGRQVYRLYPGRVAKLSDLVDLFATDPSLEPATVKEQVQEYQDWFLSLSHQRK